EAIAGVVIGRDGFRIAIGHDRLVTVVTKCERSMAAAVIELNSLPDAIRTATQDDHFLFRSRRRLVFFLVGRIEIWSVALKLGRAGINALVDGLDFVFLAQMADLFLRAFTVKPPHARQASVGEAVALRLAQGIAWNRLHGMLLHLQLHVVDLFELVEEPWVDGRHDCTLLPGVTL